LTSNLSLNIVVYGARRISVSSVLDRATIRGEEGSGKIFRDSNSSVVEGITRNDTDNVVNVC
jgi:hypothetical protein